MKKISELTDKEKKIIHEGIFYLIIVAILLFSVKAWFIYQEQGFSHCLEEKNDITGETTRKCFNTSKERTDYLQKWANNLDYNYINDSLPISSVDRNISR